MQEEMQPLIRAIVRRGRRGPALVGSLVVASLLMAACSGGPSGGGVASAGSTTSVAHAASKGSTRASGLAYAQCIRSHGISNFPDPNSQGQISLRPSEGINISSPQYEAAQEACKSLQPGAGTPAQQAQHTAAALKYSQCMRAHGVPNFPDPNGQGGFEIQPGAGIDPNSPQYQSANRTCAHFMSGTPGGGQTITKGLQ